jgi:hypothetical protein
MEKVYSAIQRTFILLILSSGILGLHNGCGPQKPASIDSAIEQRDEYNSGFAVWQGFGFNWTYNHRVNRFGNYVTFETTPADSYRVNSVQTAATGIGDDQGRYRQGFAFVHIDGAEVIKKRLQFNLENRKGLPVESVETVEFDLKDRRFRDPKIITLLNGFDMISKNSAQKLQTLTIEVSDVTYNPAAETGSYNVTATLNMDCSSIECNKLDRRYNYRLEVEVVLIAVPDFLHVTRDTVSTSLEWTRKKEPERQVITSEIPGIGKNRFAAAFLGVKRIHTSLGREHWYLDWETGASLTKYDPLSGIGSVEYNLFFRNWAEGMRQDSPERIESKFSFREAGTGDVGMVTALVQFARGCTQDMSVQDSLRWSGKRTAPDTPEAVRSTTFHFHRDCTYQD